MNSVILKLLLVVALLGSLYAAKRMYDSHQQGIGAAAQKAVDQAATDKLNADAAKQLATLQKEKDAVDLQLTDFKRTQDVRFIQSQKKLAALSGQLRDLGQLRDPYTASSGCGGGSSGTETKSAGAAPVSADNGAKAGGLLSTELTGFLRQKDADADTINVAYLDCRASLLNLQSSSAFSH